MAKVKKQSPSELLLRWYDRHGRDLPWRKKSGKKPDAYHILLSEFMAQQTTIPVVLKYYQKFLRRWPSIEDLAKADLQEVREEWSGLGYYRRAKFLHMTAKLVVEKYRGIVPNDIKTLKTLPGIGDYTANAIRAVVYDLPSNVIDGNVNRVITRMFAIRKPIAQSGSEIRQAACSLLPAARHGDYAQALMDLGAMICTPQNPACGQCPWQSFCQAYARGLQAELPKKAVRVDKPKRFTMAFWAKNRQGQILLERRPEAGLLAGMMGVPLTAFHHDDCGRDILEKEAPFSAYWQEIAGTVRHTFTHFELYIKVVRGKIGGQAKPQTQGQFLWVKEDQVMQTGMPSVMKKIARHATTAKR